MRLWLPAQRFRWSFGLGLHRSLEPSGKLKPELDSCSKGRSSRSPIGREEWIKKSLSVFLSSTSEDVFPTILFDLLVVKDESTMLIIGYGSPEL
jgi:hypothetical protein